MVDVKGFKEWLYTTQNFSPAVISDMGSRLKRVDSIKEWNNEETYLFYLEKEEEFKKLAVSVKSQLRRVVKLYADYVQE